MRRARRCSTWSVLNRDALAKLDIAEAHEVVELGEGRSHDSPG